MCPPTYLASWWPAGTIWNSGAAGLSHCSCHSVDPHGVAYFGVLLETLTRADSSNLLLLAEHGVTRTAGLMLTLYQRIFTESCCGFVLFHLVSGVIQSYHFLAPAALTQFVSQAPLTARLPFIQFGHIWMFLGTSGLTLPCLMVEYSTPPSDIIGAPKRGSQEDDSHQALQNVSQ